MPERDKAGQMKALLGDLEKLKDKPFQEPHDLVKAAQSEDPFSDKIIAMSRPTPVVEMSPGRAVPVPPDDDNGVETGELVTIGGSVWMVVFSDSEVIVLKPSNAYVTPAMIEDAEGGAP